MTSSFRKISRVGSLTGGTRWYLNDDCLLAAKRTMYAVEYRRFYLRDLECIIVWPSRLWLWRLIVPGILLAVVGASLWLWVDSTAGEIFTGLALAWVALELALGPTAKSRLRTAGATIDLPVVQRTRRAGKILARIEAAVRASRDLATQPAVRSPGLQPAEASVSTKSETASAATSSADTPPTNGF